MISMASRDAFGGFTFAAFSAKNIPVVVAVMISLSLIESSMFFFQSKLVIYCIRFFIIRSKNYLFHAGKNIKYTNHVDVNNAPCCPTPTALRPKNITAAVAATVVMSSTSPIGYLASASAMVVMDTSSPIGFLMLL